MENDPQYALTGSHQLSLIKQNTKTVGPKILEIWDTLVQELCIKDKQYKKYLNKKGKGLMNYGLNQIFKAGFSFGPKSL